MFFDKMRCPGGVVFDKNFGQNVKSPPLSPGITLTSALRLKLNFFETGYHLNEVNYLLTKTSGRFNVN